MGFGKACYPAGEFCFGPAGSPPACSTNWVAASRRERFRRILSSTTCSLLRVSGEPPLVISAEIMGKNRALVITQMELRQQQAERSGMSLASAVSVLAWLGRWGKRYSPSFREGRRTASDTH